MKFYLALAALAFVTYYGVIFLINLIRNIFRI